MADYPPTPTPPITPPPQQPTNTMAILALVFAFLFWPLGIVFGHIGRGQIRRTGEQGRGLATAGLVISYVWGALSVILIIAFVAAAGSAVQDLEEIPTVPAAPAAPPAFDSDFEAPAPPPGPEAFAIELQVIDEDCFGSAGCNVTYVPDVTVNDCTTGQYTVVYEIDGVEGGTETSNVDVNCDTGMVSFFEENTTTSSAGSELTATVTSVY